MDQEQLNAQVREWQAMVDSEEPEEAYQEFLERHPWFLPGAHGLVVNSGHPPWPRAVISQPPLVDLSTKVPDFMWIAIDSVNVHAVVIEVERPDKRWWHSGDKLHQHSDLTTPLHQVNEWRTWFSRHLSDFQRHFRLPRQLQDRTLKLHFVIVHGRKHEANKSIRATEMRGSIDAGMPDTRITTFDSLYPDVRFTDYGTVELTPDGFRAHKHSPHPLGSEYEDTKVGASNFAKPGHIPVTPRRREGAGKDLR